VKIQAAVAWEAGAELSIEEFDLDDPRDDEILVKNVAVGVCHTDDNARLGRLPVVFPIILGHEVVAVTFTGTRPDGSPRARQNGRPVRAPFFGQSSFATHSLVTERNIVPVPADAPLRYLAGFTCGVQTGAGAILNAMPVRPGSRVAIWGAGAVGLAAVMAAAAAGDRLGHPRRRQRGPRHDRQPGRDRGRGRVARHPRHRHRRLPGGRYDQAGAHLQLKGPAGNTADPELVDTSGKVLSPLLTPEVSRG